MASLGLIALQSDDEYAKISTYMLSHLLLSNDKYVYKGLSRFCKTVNYFFVHFKSDKF